MATKKTITYSSFNFTDETQNVGTGAGDKVQKAVELMHTQIANGPVFNQVVYHGGTGIVVGQKVSNVYANYLFMIY